MGDWSDSVGRVLAAPKTLACSERNFYILTTPSGSLREAALSNI